MTEQRILSQVAHIAVPFEPFELISCRHLFRCVRSSLVGYGQIVVMLGELRHRQEEGEGRARETESTYKEKPPEANADANANANADARAWGLSATSRHGISTEYDTDSSFSSGFIDPSHRDQSSDCVQCYFNQLRVAAHLKYNWKTTPGHGYSSVDSLNPGIYLKQDGMQL